MNEKDMSRSTSFDSKTAESRFSDSDTEITEFFFDSSEGMSGLVFENAEKQDKKAPSSADSARSSLYGKNDGVIHTYVPTFTEASENYHMTGKTVKETPIVPGEGEKKTHMRTVHAVPAAYIGTVDPQTVPKAEMPEEIPVREVTSAKVAPRMYHSSELNSEALLSDEKEALDLMLRKEEKKTAAPITEEELLAAAAELAQKEEIPARQEPDELDALAAEMMANPTVSPKEETPEMTAEPEKKAASIPDPQPARSYAFFTQETTRVSSAEHTAIHTPKKKKKGREYQLFTDATKVKNSFLDSMSSLQVRLGCAIFFTLLLVGLNLASFLHFPVERYLGMTDHAAWLGFADLQLTACVVALSIPEIIAFCKELFAKHVIPVLFPLLSFLILAGYDIYVAVTEPIRFVLMGSLCALSWTVLVAGTAYRKSAAFSAFKLISSRGVKGAMECRWTRDMPRQNLALDGAVDECNSKCVRLRPTAFISDFFDYQSKSPVDTPVNLLLCGLCLTVSILVGGVFYAVGAKPFDAIFVGVLTLLSAAPTGLLLSHAYHYFCAQKECFANDSAVIGEQSLYDYAGADVIVLTDDELFGKDDVVLKRVLIYGDKSRFPVALRQMASLFTAVGGPLGDVFCATLDRKPTPATDMKYEDDGIGGVAEGAEVFAGTESYMRRHGIAMPTETDGKDPVLTNRVLYLAQAGTVYAKFILRYAFSEEFSTTLSQLTSCGVVPLVYTRDPGVQNDLLLALTMGKDCLRVFHTDESHETAPSTHVSCGMVTLGGQDQVISRICMAKAYVRRQKKLVAVSFIQSAFGALAAVGAVCLAHFASDFPYAVLLLWQCLCILGTGIVCRKSFSFRRKTKKLKEESIHA